MNNLEVKDLEIKEEALEATVEVDETVERPYTLRRLKDKELFLEFKKANEAKLFSDTALRLMSGESKFVRSVKRVRKEIRETDEALDINIEGMVAATVTAAADVAVGVASLEGAGRKAKTIGVIADRLFHSKTKSKTKELESADNSEENQQ